LILGVDVARFGSDKTCLALRKGRDLVILKKYSGLDTMEVVGKVIEMIGRYSPDLTVIDEGGLGAGVLDRLQEQKYKVRGVNFGSKADSSSYANKRAEMWGAMREWLAKASIGSSDNNSKRHDADLKDDLTGPQYKLDSQGRTLLEAKADMKKRGLHSPDGADAIAVSFAYPVARKGGSKPLKDKMLARSGRSMIQSGASNGAWMN
jgi:phage terminase large subunit